MAHMDTEFFLFDKKPYDNQLDDKFCVQNRRNFEIILQGEGRMTRSHK